MEREQTPRRVPIRELVRYYLRLGLLGFGGPVALVGQMEREMVGERKWLTKEEMREGIAVCQSLPGPLAIQVGIWISYIRGGFWGAWAGGWAFILPNFIIVAALGALYVHFGGLPWVTAIFYGVSPAVIALILHSCYRLTKLGMKDWLEWALAAAAFVITVAVRAEVALVFIACGIVGVLYYGSLFRVRASASTTPSLLVGVPLLVVGGGDVPVGAMLGKLLAFFLKAGSLTFGSGLVIVPFLEKGLVQQTGWLTEREFLVAVAMGMISPGPVVITATFVGYSRRRLLGFGRRDDRHLPAVVPARLDRRAHPRPLPDQPERTGLHQGRLRRCHRHDPWCLCPAGEDRHRRLAHGARGAGEPGGAVPVEGQQPGAGRCDGNHWVDRLPAPQPCMGLREIGDHA